MTKLSFIDGERIYLRLLVLDDIAGNYVAWLNDEAVCLNNGHHFYPYSEAQAGDYIKSMEKDRNNLVLAIVYKESGSHIGNVSLQSINYISRSAEFAILLGEKEYWGKGYAYEAAKLIITHGFETLNLNRIACGTFSTNYSMQKLASKLGFVQEGVRKQAFYKKGQYLDIIEYGLLREVFINKEV